MKVLIYIWILLLLSCTHQKLNNKSIPDATGIIKLNEAKIELPANKPERKKYHTTQDTVRIYSQSLDTLIFSKEEFNDIIDNFPELTSMNTHGPDSAYNSEPFGVITEGGGEEKHIRFDSEVGQDDYYILYAYFLKHKNGIAKYAARRKKLHEIYYDLDELFGTLNHGGTYYGHQYRRIEGYAEFSVYWYNHYENYFDRSYGITKQKAFYIGGLKQLITDEVKIDNEVSGVKEKNKTHKELFKLVDHLNKEITDNFYLRMAQSFQSDHY